jgi:hypothetical protein
MPITGAADMVRSIPDAPGRPDRPGPPRPLRSAVVDRPGGDCTYQGSKQADKELKELVTATGTTLMNLHGVGPSGAVRLLVAVGDVTRFPDRGHFTSCNGTAPIDVSSGDQVRHRLSLVTVQLRNPTEGRAYFDHKKATGKTSMEAMRALKRRLSDVVYRQMISDATAVVTGSGGHPPPPPAGMTQRGTRSVQASRLTFRSERLAASTTASFCEAVVIHHRATLTPRWFNACHTFRTQ